MLEELSKEDQLWRMYALKICGCETEADDLVNDMYLALSKHKGNITKGFIYNRIKWIYLDKLKKQSINTISLEDIERDIEYREDEILNRRYELLEMLRKDVTFFEKYVLLETHEFSLREAAEINDVPWYVFNYHKKKALNKLKDKYGHRKTK